MAALLQHTYTYQFQNLNDKIVKLVVITVQNAQCVLNTWILP